MVTESAAPVEEEEEEEDDEETFNPCLQRLE